MPISPTRPVLPSRLLSDSIASLLRLEPPANDGSPDALDASLKRYECGGYLHRLWRSTRRLETLQSVWAQALTRAHRKTALDNLEALAEFRTVGRHLVDERVPFILLKGGAYLIDLYDDPGERMLTDIDLLVQREDVKRLARRLSRVGYDIVVSDREFRRFEVKARGRLSCHFEFHWWLGRPLRSRISQEEIWTRATPALLEGVSCLRLSPEDALLYHVAHQADHLFGPSLKWTIDLREMFIRWRLDLERLQLRAAEWRLRVALGLALRHLDKLFPGAAPSGLRNGCAIGSIRSRLLVPFLTSDSTQMLAPPDGFLSRVAMQGLLIDRPIDVVRQSLRVLVRPIAQALGMGTSFAPPWDSLD